MKLLFVLYGFVGGGAERVTSIVASGLAERGHDVTILSYDEPLSYPMSDKIKYIYYREGGGLKRRWILFKDTRHTIKTIKPDVAIGVLALFSFWLRIATIGLKVKTIAWDHSSFARCKKPNSSEHFIKYWVYPMFTRVVALTDEDKKIAYFKNNIRVIPNPLTFTPCNEFPNKENLVIGVGNVSTWRTKGFDLLLQAWKQVQGQYPDWRLLIAGRGDVTYLENLKKELGCINVEISPFNNNILEVYQRASVFVLSSRTEGFPMVLLEAMSQGCACVACDNLGRTREMTGDDVCLLFETGHLKGMAEQLNYMMGHPEGRRHFAMLAIERSKLFNTNMILDKWESVLNDL